ncbi:MAG: molybdate ABC transporter substrate-binding protein [Pirellulaceae bacterium]|nr:molybdate ABC transporter substrate-binding protein [Pirellulaceae bacterium]
MNRILIALVGSVICLVGAVFLLNRSDSHRPSAARNHSEPLVMFCAASNRAVMETIREEYEKEFGRTVQIQYGPSQTLLSSIEISGTGDLFLPADDSYIELGIQKSLVAEVLPIAKMHAVVAVLKNNPKSIKSLKDLDQKSVRFVQANPDSTAIGKVTKNVLAESGQWEQLEKATVGFRTTVADVANDIAIGAADAGIVYDAVLHSYPDLQAVELPELESAVSQVSIGIIKSTKQASSALHFARYVSARDRGLLHYSKHGFQVSKGDVWEDVPELSVFAGSMLRPAIEDTIAAFEKREGVQVSRVYNGCGILVAQMKAGQRPDAYFACDSEFMKQVPDIFPESTDVSKNELVILVKKGNPLHIKSLKDLGREGIRVGIGHEKQCAMGWITQNTLREGGLQQEIMPNVTVQTPSGDMLVNQMQTGSLDAAVAYLSNAAGATEFLDAIQIQGIECSVATQPFAIAVDSPHSQTASRLFKSICSSDSEANFIAEGFSWQLKASNAK